jgi:hypothetical protein
MICPPGTVYDIIADQGATFMRTIFLKSSKKAPISLTNYTGRMHIRETVYDTDIIEAQTTANGRITIVASAGSITILIPPLDMEQIAPATYVYDLEVESPQGEVTRVVYGKFTVRPEVTK